MKDKFHFYFQNESVHDHICSVTKYLHTWNLETGKQSSGFPVELKFRLACLPAS